MTNFKDSVYFLFYVSEGFAHTCMYVHYVLAWTLWKARRGHQNPRSKPGSFCKSHPYSQPQLLSSLSRPKPNFKTQWLNSKL